MAERTIANAKKCASFWMITSFIIMVSVNARTATISYTLDNLILVDGQQITGAFDWTYGVGDFEGGNGVFTALEIPYTIYSFADGNLNLNIQSDSIEISGNGNFHDIGLDISLFLSPPLSPIQTVSLNLGSSFFECCGNGFKDQPFLSGNIIPSAFLVGDFDVDGDVDGLDFLKWQKGGFSSTPSTSDLVAWEANFGTGAILSVSTAAVPEPNAVLLCLTASFIGISFRRHS